jgi:hypothetical protein
VSAPDSLTSSLRSAGSIATRTLREGSGTSSEGGRAPLPAQSLAFSPIGLGERDHRPLRRLRQRWFFSPCSTNMAPTFAVRPSAVARSCPSFRVRRACGRAQAGRAGGRG